MADKIEEALEAITEVVDTLEQVAEEHSQMAMADDARDHVATLRAEVARLREEAAKAREAGLRDAAAEIARLRGMFRVKPGSELEDFINRGGLEFYAAGLETPDRAARENRD